VHDAAAGVLRRPDRTLARASGALLPIRLAATAAHLTTRLRRAGALTGRGLLATTTWWIRATLTGASNSSAGNSTVEAVSAL
jgi:hypothetical protein